VQRLILFYFKESYCSTVIVSLFLVLVIIDVLIIPTEFAVDPHDSMLVWYPFFTGHGYKITRGLIY